MVELPLNKESIALVGHLNILMPRGMARDEPTNKLLAEQTDKRRTEIWVPGRTVGIYVPRAREDETWKSKLECIGPVK